MSESLVYLIAGADVDDKLDLTYRPTPDHFSLHHPLTTTTTSTLHLLSTYCPPLQVTWKSKLKAAFPDPNNYSAFMGNFSTATGMVTLLMMLAGRVVFKKFGWGVAAMITPITLLTTGTTLFIMLFYSILFYSPIYSNLKGLVSIENHFNSGTRRY